MDLFELFTGLPHELQALAAGLFTYALTALGAAAVFLFKKVNKNILDAMLGFAGGVMTAASFFSLISPAVIMSESLGFSPWGTVTAGFLAGGLLLFAGDRIYDAIAKKKGENGMERHRSLMLLFSITLHNIPEGLAVGVAFGSLAYGIEGATVGAAVMLAVGIGIQNLPEGLAVSLPLLREGMTKRKAFFCGHISGAVEPVAAFLGAVLVMGIRVFLPFLLSFAAGAMIYVVVEEIIPESQKNERKEIMAVFTIAGFAVMTALDLAFS